jgi:hypothetical protein
MMILIAARRYSSVRACGKILTLSSNEAGPNSLSAILRPRLSERVLQTTVLLAMARSTAVGQFIRESLDLFALAKALREGLEFRVMARECR